MEFDDGTKDIIGAYYEVYNVVGAGFLEKVYENAMKVEFSSLGIGFGSQVPIEVCYKSKVVGDYVADFIVGNVVVEIKAKSNLNGVDEAQLLNYLRGTGKRVGLIFNFGGAKPEFKRLVFG